jgi:FKBP-type peptidyl-prolyl cis-trans isomerase FklB
MKSALSLLSVMILLSGQVWAAEATALKSSKDKLSYSIGVSVGKTIQQQELDIDVNKVVVGLKDVLKKGKLAMTEDEMRQILTALQKDLMEKQIAKNKDIAEKNKKEGEAFLAENKKKEGVITLPSGIQYKIITASVGKKPTEADTIECNYRGTLINGTEFDSSYRTGKAATFKLSTLIPGWRDALVLMPVGSKWQIFIPAALAYGERGQGPITPNSTLIFEVELLAIK